MRRRQRFYQDNQIDHAYATSDGSKRLGRYRPRQETEHADSCNGDPDAYLDQFEHVLRPHILKPLLLVYVDGVSPAELARRNGTHRGTEKRRLQRLIEEARPGALAVLADQTIRRGFDCFALNPRSGQLIYGLDLWAVPVPGQETQYDHVPTLDELHLFVVEHLEILFGKDDTLFDVCLCRPWGPFVLDVTKLYPSEAAAEAARHRLPRSSRALNTDGTIGLPRPRRKAA